MQANDESLVDFSWTRLGRNNWISGKYLDSVLVSYRVRYANNPYAERTLYGNNAFDINLLFQIARLGKIESQLHT